MFVIRLDDACPHMNIINWLRVEQILDKYGIRPIVAIIPNCCDKKLTDAYTFNKDFWKLATDWRDKGWGIALHGYNHLYTNMHNGGLNPVNSYSEFCGLPFEEQREKIRKGIEVFSSHGLTPKFFVAPAHTFDENTLNAIKSESSIKLISDTVANDVYMKADLFFIPLQCGRLRELPFRIVTGCYHPNSMKEKDFEQLELFLGKNQKMFLDPDKIILKERQKSVYDKMLQSVYFFLRTL